MPAWVDSGFAEYQKRVRGRVQLDLKQIPSIKRGKNADIKRVIEQEDKKLRAAIPSASVTVALDRLGKTLSTKDIARKMEYWLQNGDHVALLVGGPEGLSQSMVSECNECWSLSALTFAHPVVRVMLAEQIYRCYSLLEGLPYHR